MADLALVTAARVRVVESIEQATLVAAETITAGEIVRIDTNGKFTGSNGTTTTENAAYGMAVKSCVAGQAVTAVRRGILDSYELSGMAYWAPIYLSDTDGLPATTAGTVSTIIGRVMPATGQTLGTAADKLFYIEL
jgi:hypothetical protein